MIKSTRIEKNPEHAFLDMLCVDKIEKVLVVFTVKQSSSEKGGAIHILSLGLAHMQTVIYSSRLYILIPMFINVQRLLLMQVDLRYNPICRVSWSPSQSELVLVGKSHPCKLTCLVWDVDIFCYLTACR